MKSIEVVSISAEELAALLERLRSGKSTESDYETVELMGETIRILCELVAQKTMSISRLRRILFGAKTEKTSALLSKPSSRTSSREVRQAQGSVRKGHGRTGCELYKGATRVWVEHPFLKPGDPCPLCPKGKVYREKRPARILRIEGQAPIRATLYELDRVRCNGCGAVFTAPVPEEAGSEKYAPSASTAVSLSRYGMGLPFSRLEALQAATGIPLPDATQWELVERKARRIGAAYQELVRQAAQGEVLHNDDTPMRILELMKRGGSAEEQQDQQEEGRPEEKRSRTGVYTTGIISVLDDSHRVALFYTGAKVAGENLLDLLQQRETSLAPPIQMSDALPANRPKGVAVRAGSCLVHARRHFADIVEEFPEACEIALETIRDVFQVEAEAKERELSPEERLRFRQQLSGPLMQELKSWIESQFADKTVEPNGNLGKAFKHILKHWEKLTLFLREANAPLENNIVERGLKKAIRHRRNSLFYKTAQGAAVGDLFMSLIHTCSLNNANPFDYLNQLDIRCSEVREHPGQWMPWNYHRQVERQGDQPTPA